MEHSEVLDCRSRSGLERGARTGSASDIVLARMAEPSAARFNRFSRGRTVGQAEAGVVRERIRTSVLKTDGTAASLRAIDAVFAKARADPEWAGADFSDARRRVARHHAGTKANLHQSSAYPPYRSARWLYDPRTEDLGHSGLCA